MVKLASQLLHFRAKIASQTVHLKDFVPPCVLCLTHGPVRLHHAIFLNITQPKGTNLKIYPMHEFKTLNSKTWDESRVMIVLNIKN